MGVQALSWDPLNQRLAVALSDQQDNHPKLALFATDKNPVLTAKLVGYIEGPQSGDGISDLVTAASFMCLHPMFHDT